MNQPPFNWRRVCVAAALTVGASLGATLSCSAPSWAEPVSQAGPPQASPAQALPSQALPSQAPQVAPLPDEATAQQALSRLPAWQSALQAHRAELARAQATSANPNDWTPSANWARRAVRRDPAEPGRASEREWAVGLSRGLRLPGKADAAEGWAQRQRERAEAQLALIWLELGRGLIQDTAEWLLASQQARLWEAHWRLQQEQHQAVSRRHQLGDAARQDVILLDAARAQAESQWLQARHQARVAEASWRSRYPGLILPAWPDGAALVAEAAVQVATPLTPEALDARLADHPAWRHAELHAQVLEAQARHAEAERRPDPTVGVQYGRDANGAERVWGVNVSWPIGGEARSRQAEAQVADALAARTALEGVRRQLQLELARHLAEVALGDQAWRASAHAAAQTQAAAQALRKGQELGQVGVSEVLLMQRQLIEQQQVAAQAELNAWQARMRWELESGGLWAPPRVD